MKDFESSLGNKLLPHFEHAQNIIKKGQILKNSEDAAQQHENINVQS